MKQPPSKSDRQVKERKPKNWLLYASFGCIGLCIIIFLVAKFAI